MFYRAEACYQKLRKSSQKQKYRHNWLRCIEKYQAVYRHDPAGPWAAAGLYMSGELYLQLYKRSYLKSDQEEALDIFKRIVRRFPKSRYRQKAADAIDAIPESGVKKVSSPSKKKTKEKSAPQKSKTPREKYVAAEACYSRLRNHPRKHKYRDSWFKCIDQYEGVYHHDPSGPWAAAGLYMSGMLHLELSKHSFLKSDKKQAFDNFERIVKNYPKSAYRTKAENILEKYQPGRIHREVSAEQKSTSKKSTPKTGQFPKDIKAGPSSENHGKEDTLESLIKPYDVSDSIEKSAVDKRNDVYAAKSRTTVTGLRFWSNPSYTRVVIDADKETSYMHRMLKEDPSIRKPERLFVDLNNSHLKEDIEKFIPIHDNLLSDMRAGQYKPETVRVVIDIKSSDRYKIFSLRNPFRIVIDVWGGVSRSAGVDGPKSKTPPLGKEELPPSALAKQLALGVRRIVIDPGHGGRDYGAPGYLKGVHEKHITLKIARQLSERIRKDLGCEVFLTRTSDRFLTLEERTAIANTQSADLFISLHANSSRDRRAYGIETYFLNLATDDESIRVAARENATSEKNISDLETILNDLMQNAKIHESSRLAGHVQESLCSHLKIKYSRVKNKGVKQAPFYVLLGAQMPAILIETSFISNSRECKRLNNPKYQDQLCEGIVEGIKEYIEDTIPTASLRESKGKGAEI
ncbi:N-acetylmuramoyl-L-alanine amidase [Thermodesulfobacteriota bacterium]